jgi:hypothetical protein
MISAAYRQRAAADLKNRITKVLLNGKETPIADISVKVQFTDFSVSPIVENDPVFDFQCFV